MDNRVYETTADDYNEEYGQGAGEVHSNDDEGFFSLKNDKRAKRLHRSIVARFRRKMVKQMLEAKELSSFYRGRSERKKLKKMKKKGLHFR